MSRFAPGDAPFGLLCSDLFGDLGSAPVLAGLARFARTDHEGDRHPVRRGDLFIVGLIGSGATLASSSGNNVLPVVLGASALVLLACLRIPPRGGQRACG